MMQTRPVMPDPPEGKRKLIKLLSNAPDLQPVFSQLEPYISLTLREDLKTALDSPESFHALVYDAAKVPADLFRQFVRYLRDLHASGRYLPTLLLTTHENPVPQREAFMAGIADILEHPVQDECIELSVNRLIKTSRLWRELEEDTFIKRKTDICLASMRNGRRHVTGCSDSVDKRISPNGFDSFVSLLAHDLSATGYAGGKLKPHNFAALLRECEERAIPRSHLIRMISDYTSLSQVTTIIPETLVPGILPPEFCTRNLVLPLQLRSDGYSLAFGNPFDWELVTVLRQLSITHDRQHLCVADPDALRFALSSHSGKTAGILPAAAKGAGKARLETLSGNNVQEICSRLLVTAVRMRASDIHIEPKASMHLVRFRIDGDLQEIFCLDETGHRVISRYKLLGSIDISENRKPQDGSYDTTILNRRYTLRMATSPTPDGESITIRILDTDAGLQSLMELGMNATQEQSVISLAARSSGMVLFVGPTGCGKTTSIYSLLAHIDCQKRSLVSVEDPVEYHIPAAIQHHVNQQAGVTFELLLKSSVRQDPDILFIGEIRDPASAQIVMDFTSTGHLTFSSLHTVNAVSSIFRLERLGVSRRVMAESILAIVAQKLVKRVCPECKEIGPVSAEERETLLRFVPDPPEVVAHPRGCDFCNGTGYFGRTAVFEIVTFNGPVVEMLLSNRSVCDIRSQLKTQGEYLITNHAIDKVRQLVCSPKDVIASVLLEELVSETSEDITGDVPALQALETASTSPRPRLLLIDDDLSILELLESYLGRHGYECDRAGDGVDALLKLGGNTYDLIISDIMMPNLDGFKMLELFKLKGIDVPLIFMTAYTGKENERRAMDLGAGEFIQKPLDLGAVVKTVRGMLT